MESLGVYLSPEYLFKFSSKLYILARNPFYKNENGCPDFGKKCLTLFIYGLNFSFNPFKTEAVII